MPSDRVNLYRLRRPLFTEDLVYHPAGTELQFVEGKQPSSAQLVGDESEEKPKAKRKPKAKAKRASGKAVTDVDLAMAKPGDTLESITSKE